MLYTEYDSELAKKVLVEETAQEAEEKGKAEGRAATIKQLLKNGLSADKIISLLEMSNEEASLYFGDV